MCTCEICVLLAALLEPLCMYLVNLSIKDASRHAEPVQARLTLGERSSLNSVLRPRRAARGRFGALGSRRGGALGSRRGGAALAAHTEPHRHRTRLIGCHFYESLNIHVPLPGLVDACERGFLAAAVVVDELGGHGQLHLLE